MNSTRGRTGLAVCAGFFGATLVGALLARSRLPVRDDPDDTDIALVSIFDGTSLRPVSRTFRGGSVVSMFGGTQLDLRRTVLDSDRGCLRVTTIFGGTDITVPDTWHVTVGGINFAAGVEKVLPSQLPPSNGQPGFDIEAYTIFGGLRIVARPVLRAADETA